MILIMKILDFLFNICYAPFQKEPNGRFIALIWLLPSLVFFFIGLLNICMYSLGVSIISNITPLSGSFGAISIFVFFSLALDKIYIKHKRNTGEIKFVILHGLLIPVMVIGSIIFFSMSLYKFR